MLFLKYLLMTLGIGMILVAAAILSHDLYLELKHRRAMLTPGEGPIPPAPQFAGARA